MKVMKLVESKQKFTKKDLAEIARQIKKIYPQVRSPVHRPLKMRKPQFNEPQIREENKQELVQALASTDIVFARDHSVSDPSLTVRRPSKRSSRRHTTP